MWLDTGRWRGLSQVCCRAIHSEQEIVKKSEEGVLKKWERFFPVMKTEILRQCSELLQMTPHEGTLERHLFCWHFEGRWCSSQSGMMPREGTFE